MSLLDQMQQRLGPDEIAQISRQLGTDPAQTQSAVQAALPMLLGGMAGQARQPDGADAIQQAVGVHGGLLDNLGGLLGAAGLGDGGGGLLGRILGQHQDTVQQGVQQASGLDASQTRRLLMVLAPIVLAFLARRHAAQAQQPTDQAQPTDIGGTLQHEAQAAREQTQRSSPHVGGLLGKILSHVETPR